MSCSHRYYIDADRWVACMHEDVAELYIEIQNMLYHYTPDLMIELGTKYGGMTMVFHRTLPEVPLYSYDHIKYNRTNKLYAHEGVEIHPEWYGSSVKFIVEDILTPNQGLIDLIRNEPGKVFLYCDNGNKVAEVLTYGPYLKSRDILGFHDCPSEITPEQVEPVLKDFDPLPINQWMVGHNCSDRFYIKK